MSWEDKELEELTLYVKRGVSPKYVLENGIPIVNQRCIRENTINFDTARLSSKDKKITEVKFLQVGDTVINSTGVGTLGRTAFVKKLDQPSSADTHVTIVRPDKTKVNPKFLSLYLNSQEDIIENMGKGATGQTELSAKDLNDLKVFHPKSLQTQKRIADILSAYDDLIENNLKRIKLLEQAAQNIYKEWFVNLRFPGHKNTPINEETGLPVGWEEVLMEDIMNVSGGGTPSTKEPLYWENGKVLWFSPTDLNKNNSLVLIDSTKKITELGLKKSSAKLLSQRTILMSSRATIGLFGLFNGECSTNQGFININPKEESLRYYILFNLKSRVEELISNASGATFKELSKRVFKRMSIVNPDTNILTKFFKQAELVINQTENLELQNQKLKAARDILLPRLMNRTIEV